MSIGGSIKIYNIGGIKKPFRKGWLFFGGGGEEA